jgi:hypothetical protein
MDRAKEESPEGDSRVLGFHFRQNVCFRHLADIDAVAERKADIPDQLSNVRL